MQLQLLHSFAEIEHPVASVCSVGTFDGVHLGHQQLIRAVVNDAHARGVQSAIVTFYPHPRVVLGRAPAKYLTTPEAKAEQMALLGVDVLVIHEFTQETVQTRASEFVRWLVEYLRMVSLWIGPDFALGHKRQGDAAYLTEQGKMYGFQVNVMPELNMGMSAISSTRVRDALAHGDVRDANLCLGRPYRICGTYNGERTICVDDELWLPVAGTYPVLIEGRVNQATLSTDSPCSIVLEHRLRDGVRPVKVEFV